MATRGGLPGRWLAETVSAAGAVSLVAGLAGLTEGILLAVVYDPFQADWLSRVWSVSTFAIFYMAAGLLVGAILFLPVRLLVRPFAASPALAAAITCGMIGGGYVWMWMRALGGGKWSPLQQAGIAIAGCVLFFIAGAASCSLTRRLGGAGALAAAAGVAGAVSLGAATNGGTLIAHHLGGAEPSHQRVPPASATVDHPAARNVLMVVADTLRADHMSMYGYERETSPRIERFAREGVLFTNAIVQKTKTSPSVASILTGTYPHTHGIVGCGTVLPESSLTLAEILLAGGYATHSIVANSNVGAAFNFDQGFESVDEIWAGRQGARAEGVTDHALRWLTDWKKAGASRPFFLYVHYIDPHAPYAPPAPYDRMFLDDSHYGRHAGIKVGPGRGSIGAIRSSVLLEERPTDVDFYVARYDAEIAYLDSHVGRLWDGLAALGLADDTLVVFTSDHGEALSEHDVFFGHGLFAYEDTARVPLVMRLPGGLPAGSRVDTVVQVASLAPTVLEAVGIPRPDVMELEGLWTLAARKGREEEGGAEKAAAFIEAGTVPETLSRAIRTREWKLIENPGGIDLSAGRFDLRTIASMSRKSRALELARTGRQFLASLELYDLLTDPMETRNLVRERPEVIGMLRDRLSAFCARAAGRARLEPTPDSSLPPEVLENLKSLGYVN